MEATVEEADLAAPAPAAPLAAVPPAGRVVAAREEARHVRRVRAVDVHPQAQLEGALDRAQGADVLPDAREGPAAVRAHAPAVVDLPATSQSSVSFASTASLPTNAPIRTISGSNCDAIALKKSHSWTGP